MTLIMTESEPISPGPSLLNGLLAWWRLGEPTGQPRLDSSGNGHTLAVNGTVAQVIGLRGDASYLSDLTTDWMAIADPIVSSGPLTLAFWFKFPDYTEPTNCFFFAQSDDPESVLGISAEYSYGLLIGHVGNVAYVNAGLANAGIEPFVIAGMANNVWYHVTLIFDGTNSTTYLDGVAGTPFGDNFPVGVMAGIGVGNTINGLAPDPGRPTVNMMGIWNRVLSSGEIAELFNAGTGLDYPF